MELQLSPGLIVGGEAATSCHQLINSLRRVTNGKVLWKVLESIIYKLWKIEPLGDIHEQLSGFILTAEICHAEFSSCKTAAWCVVLRPVAFIDLLGQKLSIHTPLLNKILPMTLELYLEQLQ